MESVIRRTARAPRWGVQAQVGPGIDASQAIVEAIERATAPHKPELLVTIGVDLGQKRDPTAIAVLNQLWSEPEQRVVDRGVEGTWLEPGKREEHWFCRHIERLPLGTSYTHVARRIAEVARNAADRTRLAPTVFVDATGLGQPVLDTLAETGMTAYAGLVGVVFTYGDRLDRDDRGGLRLGKAYLVARLQALLEGGRLHLPATAEAHQLARELQDYEIRIDANANDRYGAFKTGAHDDLVTALGLGVATGAARTYVF